jgi:hypothetical protein
MTRFCAKLMLHGLDVGLDRAGRLDRLEDGNQIARPDPKRVQSINNLLEGNPFGDERQLLAVLLHADAGARHQAGLPASERSRLADLRGLADCSGLPCATATVETRTSRPMTMTPERSSITIRAPRSGATWSCSISVSKAMTLP